MCVCLVKTEKRKLCMRRFHLRPDGAALKLISVGKFRFKFKQFLYLPFNQNCTWLSITVHWEQLPYLQQLLPPGATGWRPMGSSMLRWSAPHQGAPAGCKPRLIWWGGSSLPDVVPPTLTASLSPAWSHSQCWWAPGGGCHTGSGAEHMNKNCDFNH